MSSLYLGLFNDYVSTISYQMGTTVYFPNGKVARAWSWVLITSCRGLESASMLQYFGLEANFIYFLRYICYVVGNMWRNVNNELGEIWKEAVVVCFKVLFRNLPRGTKENNETPHSHYRSPDRDLNVASD